MSKLFHNPGRFALVILAFAASAWGQEVKLTIANADEIIAALPDVTLSKDLLEPIDRDLWTIEFHRRGGPPEPTDYVRELIRLAAPDGIGKYQFTVTNGTPLFTLSPVPDFEAFLASIDYGEVVSSDASGRRVQVKIDVAELQPDRLRARAERKGDNAADQTDAMLRGKHPASRRSKKRELPTNRLGGKYEPGDYVEVLVAKQLLYGTVEELEVGSFRKLLVKVRLLDLTKLMKLAEKRSHRTRLERAGEFVFWVPAARLRKLSGPPTPAPEERTWADTTGKYKIVATYDGVEGDRVLLKRAGGKVTKVPLAKLCEADRSYVERLTSNDANPFAGQASVAGGTLRADWSRVKAIPNVASRKWRWKPPAIPKPAYGEPSGKAIDLDTPTGASVEEFYVSADGQSAIVQMEEGFGRDGHVYLQYVDLSSGAVSGLIECPPKAAVLDARPEDRMVVLKSEAHDEESQVYLQRLGEEALESVCDFNASEPGEIHDDIEGARLLPGSRVLTHRFSGNAILWDYTTATALYSIEDVSGTSPAMTLDPTGQFLFADAGRAVLIIDHAVGKQVAAIPHSLNIKKLSVDNRLKRLGITGGENSASIDLNKGEVLHALLGGVKRGDLDFIGRMWLVENRYLVDPEYPLMLWQYVMNSGSQSNHATVRGRQMWYVAQEGGGDNATWSVASIPLPHGAVRAKLAEIGDPNDLIILQEGDQVLLVLDTDLDAAQETKLRQAATNAFQAAGYTVVAESDAGADAKEAVVTCKRAAPVEIKIANPKAKPPKDNPNAFKPPPGFAIPRMSMYGFGGPLAAHWMYESHTISPYNSTLSIRYGGEVLWTDGAEITAGQKHHPRPDESVQDVIRRLTTPDIDRLLAIELPAQLCKTGPIGGTFGASLLDADGIFKDITDPKQLEE